MDFVVVEVRPLPLDAIGGCGPGLHLDKGGTVAVNEISIVRNVGNYMNAGRFQRVAPLWLDGAGELDQVKAFATGGKDRFAQRLDFSGRGVEVTGIQRDDVLVVGLFSAGMR